MEDARPVQDTELTIIARRQGRIGRITLNRPRALNALDPGMIGAMQDTLLGWRDDPAVHAVVVEGAGERAFCAGGDIRAIRAMGLEGNWAGVHRFFASEYALDLLVARYPKPCVSLIDGICMGGGIGVSVHGSARVVTEAAMFAMPETGIGFFPDVGTSYVLPRLRDSIGMYMALTGARVSGADAVHAGLATHFTTRERLAGLADELAEHGMSALAAAALPAPAGVLQDVQDDLRCFGAGSVPGVLAALESRRTPWADATIAAIRSVSPSAVLWSFELMRNGAMRDLEGCFRAELVLADLCARHPDFAEGVRAMVVDKDRTPRWTPPRIEDVPDGAVETWRSIIGKA